MKSALPVSQTANNAEFTRKLLLAAKRMAKQVRASHRRFGLPLLIERNGKIVSVKA